MGWWPRTGSRFRSGPAASNGSCRGIRRPSRPEPGETWEQTLRREMDEEACATVTGARLLGFTHGRCLTGPERGTVLAALRDYAWLRWAAAPARSGGPAVELSPQPDRIDVICLQQRASWIDRPDGPAELGQVPAPAPP
jgi:hypothetical protein